MPQLLELVVRKNQAEIEIHPRASLLYSSLLTIVRETVLSDHPPAEYLEGHYDFY
jgi:hypothetical protein